MNLHNTASANMDHIQKIFLGVQRFMQENDDPEMLIRFLNSEPPEFRSVVYESASMELAFNDLSAGKDLTNWKQFYQRSLDAHTFHMDIGLGWAFAKTGISPTPYFKFLPPPVMRSMVFDGIGYYYGLFKGRSTLKNQLLPGNIEQHDQHGFDQGLGRRLWYIAKADVNEFSTLINRFPLNRHADLWRGLGIACGYVGGTSQQSLEHLRERSGGFKDQLCRGLALAAVSRNASKSVTADIELACTIICGKSLKDAISTGHALKNISIIS